MKKIYTYFGGHQLNECQINDGDIQAALESDDMETVLGYLAVTNQIQNKGSENQEDMENSDIWAYIDSTMSDYKFVGYVNIDNLMIEEV